MNQHDISLSQFKSHESSLLEHQSGYTLTELMLSLSLGLIISLAAFKLFSHSLDIQRIQQSNLDIQESAIFNLNAMKMSIGLANQGSSLLMTHLSPWTGIVMTESFNSSSTIAQGEQVKLGNLRGVSGIADRWLTQSQIGPSNIEEPSNSNQVSSDKSSKSDQLTIQYLAGQDGYDCEGRSIKKGEMVVQRYFTRYDKQRAKNESKALAIVLACDAGRYDPLNIATSKVTKDISPIRNFGDNGVILMNRIDFFEVKLGVRQNQGVSYMSIERYLQSNATAGSEYTFNNPIVAIEIGLIIRGHHTIKYDIANPTEFILNGQNRIINTKYPSYLRRPVQTVIYLRHGENRF